MPPDENPAKSPAESPADPTNPAEPGATEAPVEDAPIVSAVGEVATHHDDLENPDAELSDALSVDSLSMTTFKPQLRIN